MSASEVGNLVGRCSTLAALLEVSAYPKPGNVHRFRDYPKTRYEHFLASSVAIESHMRALALRSFKINAEKRDWMALRMGDAIRGSVEDMLHWQSGGNVHLGIILLFAPLAAAAGASCNNQKIVPIDLRENLRKIISVTTPDDTVNIYKSISLAMSRENLGSVDKLDVSDTSSLARIRYEGLKPPNVFSLCSERDSICSEWISDFNIVFTEGYSILRKKLDNGLNINDSIVGTFLEILSAHPDSLIRRKLGEKKAIEVSNMALGVISTGGAMTKEGRKLLDQMDEDLRNDGGSMNPGTTADLTAASLFVLLLTGWRP